VFLECIEQKHKFPIPFSEGHINMILAGVIKKCVPSKEDLDKAVVREVHV
jgi:hypothetical protein